MGIVNWRQVAKDRDQLGRSLSFLRCVPTEDVEDEEATFLTD